MGRGPRVVVVTGSDLGRSPRMVRHARALVSMGCAVTLVGAAGHTLGRDVERDPRLSIQRLILDDAPPTFPRHRWLTGTALRLGRFGARLRRAIMTDGSPAVVLVQTPPGTPVVDVCATVARRCGAALVLDWHNLEASMVGLRLGQGHPLVRLLARHEARRAGDAALHLAVTDGLADVLRGQGRRAVVTFADRPERWLPRSSTTPATRAATRATHRLPDGPLAVMSSSFSLDDDLDLLEAGLRAFGRPLSLLLTGDGPRRAATMARLATVPGLRVLQRFVAADDYLDVLATADVGLCLHRSASGLDFPMKLTDYAAARVPSLALDDGPTLRAGLRRGDRTFVDAATFAAGLARCLDGHRTAVDDNDHDKEDDDVDPTWQEAWLAEVWPVLSPHLRR